MYAVRLWSVRHAKGLNRFYKALERVLIALHPVWHKIGYDKVERPFQVMEAVTKGFRSIARCVVNAHCPRPVCPAR